MENRAWRLDWWCWEARHDEVGGTSGCDGLRKLHGPQLSVVAGSCIVELHKPLCLEGSQGSKLACVPYLIWTVTLLHLAEHREHLTLLRGLKVLPSRLLCLLS